MANMHIDPDISRASTLSSGFYTSPEYWELFKERCFAPSWQYIGVVSEIADPGAFFPRTLLEGYLDEPLLLTRDKSGTARCLSNVCTHRGNLLAWGPGKSSQLRCRYHGRIFQLNGAFSYMPEFEGVVDFPAPCDDLHRLPLQQWGPLLFTQLVSGKAFEEVFGWMQQRVSFLPLDAMTINREGVQTFTVKAHWALYCENYLEGFHIPFVHGGLNAILDYSNYVTECHEQAVLQIGIGKTGEDCFEIPPESPDHGRDIAAYYFWIFPNMMFNFYPWGLSFNLIEPLGPELTRVTFIPFVFDASKLERGAGAGLDRVELEDEEVVEMVQKGIRSRFYSRGRYAPKREQGTHHFHRLLSGLLDD